LQREVDAIATRYGISADSYRFEPHVTIAEIPTGATINERMTIGEHIAKKPFTKTINANVTDVELRKSGQGRLVENASGDDYIFSDTTLTPSSPITPTSTQASVISEKPIEIAELNRTQSKTGVSNIMAMGDIHANIDVPIDILAKAKFIKTTPAGYEVIAEKGDKVILAGDWSGRGSNTQQVYSTLMDLQEKAQNKGSDIVVLVGNHDALDIAMYRMLSKYSNPNQLMAEIRKVYGEARGQWFEKRNDFENVLRGKLSQNDMNIAFDYEIYGGRTADMPMFLTHPEYINWASKNPIMRLENGDLFVHSDIPNAYSELLNKYNEYAKSNLAEVKQFELSKRGLTGQELNVEKVNYIAKKLLDSKDGAYEVAKILEGARQEGVNGRNWGAGDYPKEGSDLLIGKNVNSLLNKFGGERVVSGHTPHTKIKIQADGKAIGVDVLRSDNKQILQTRIKQAVPKAEGLKQPSAQEQITLNSLADKIEKGIKDFTPEELQVQANWSKNLESILQERASGIANEVPKAEAKTEQQLSKTSVETDNLMPVKTEAEALADWHEALTDYGKGLRPEKISSLYPEESSNRLNILAMASNNPDLVGRASRAYSGLLSLPQYRLFVKDAVKELFNVSPNKEVIRQYTQSYIELKDKLALGKRDELLPRFIDDTKLWNNADAMKKANIPVEKVKQATNGLMSDAEYGNIMRQVLDTNLKESERANFGEDRINRMVQSAVTDYKNYRETIRGETEIGIGAGEQAIRVAMGKEGRPEAIETGWPGKTSLTSIEKEKLLVDRALQIPELAERAQKVRDGKLNLQERAEFLKEAVEKTGLWPTTDMIPFYNKRTSVGELFQWRIQRLNDVTRDIIRELGNKVANQYQESALREVVRLSGDLLQQSKELYNEAKIVSTRKGYQVLEISNKILSDANTLYEAVARKSWIEAEKHAAFLRDFFTGQYNKDYYTLRDLYDVTNEQLQTAKAAGGWLLQQKGMNINEQYNTVALKLQPVFEKLRNNAQTLKVASEWLIGEASNELKAQYNTQKIKIDDALNNFKDTAQNIKNKIDQAKATGVWLNDQLAMELEAQYNARLLAVKDTIDSLSAVSNKVRTYFEDKVGTVREVGKWTGQQLSAELNAQYNTVAYTINKITDKQIELAKLTLSKIEDQMQTARASSEWLRDRVSNELQATYNRQLLNAQNAIDVLNRVVKRIDNEVQVAKQAGGWLSNQAEMELRAAYNKQILNTKNALDKLDNITLRVATQIDKQVGTVKAIGEFLGQRASNEMKAQYNTALFTVDKITEAQIALVRNAIDNVNTQIQTAKLSSEWLKDRIANELQATYNQQVLNVKNAVDNFDKLVTQINSQIQTAKRAGGWLSSQVESELLAKYNEQISNVRSNIDKLATIAENIDTKLGQTGRQISLEAQRQYNVLLINAEDAIAPMIQGTQKLLESAKEKATWINTTVSAELQARYIRQLENIRTALEPITDIAKQLNSKIETLKLAGEEWLRNEVVLELQRRYDEQLAAFNAEIGKLATVMDEIKRVGGDKVTRISADINTQLNLLKEYRDGTLKNFAEYAKDIQSREPLGATALKRVSLEDAARYYEKGYLLEQEIAASKRLIKEQLGIKEPSIKGKISKVEEVVAGIPKETKAEFIETSLKAERYGKARPTRIEVGIEPMSAYKDYNGVQKSTYYGGTIGYPKKKYPTEEVPYPTKPVYPSVVAPSYEGVPKGKKPIDYGGVPTKYPEKPPYPPSTKYPPTTQYPSSVYPPKAPYPTPVTPATPKYPPTMPTIPGKQPPVGGITIKTKHGDKYLSQGDLQASIAWRQGKLQGNRPLYKLWFPPYGQKDIHNSLTAIEGVEYKEGLRSAYESAKVLFGGDIPNHIQRTMGVVNIHAYRGPDKTKPVLHFDETYNKPKAQRHSHKEAPNDTSIGTLR
jgi:hypothetical protein